MTQPKKQKKEEEDPFAIVKQYLLDCPHLPGNHPVIKAAIEGVEKEETKQARDAKLQRKFAQSTSSRASNSAKATSAKNNNSALSDAVLVMAPPSSANSEQEAIEEDDADMESEWQDVEPTAGGSNAIESGAAAAAAAASNSEQAASSYLGRELAKSAIDKIAEHRMTVCTPLSAIALVIHAALRSLDFKCTGIPETGTSGFAAPVRELPKSQFVPPRWDNNRTLVQLRYRKDGTGAIKLMVQLEKNSEFENEQDERIQVQISPANSQEPPSQTLTFALDEHINMDSWKAATSKNRNIAPALHFKFLPILLTKFCQMYDLGSPGTDNNGDTNSMPYVDNTISTNILNNYPPTTSTTTTMPSPSVPVAAVSKPWENNGNFPSTLDQAFPQIAVGTNQGHFADDLTPAGLRDPLRMGNGRMGGNLMGPNHPRFMGGGPGMVGGPGMGPGTIGGPGTMQPRFDPILPPGAVDIGVDGQPRRNRPSRTGEPNPDHLRPPNSFAGDSMFM